MLYVPRSREGKARMMGALKLHLLSKLYSPHTQNHLYRAVGGASDTVSIQSQDPSKQTPYGYKLLTMR